MRGGADDPGGPTTRRDGTPSSRSTRAWVVIGLLLLAALDSWLSSDRNPVWPTWVFYAVALLAAGRGVIDRHSKVGAGVVYAAVAGTSAALTVSAILAGWSFFGPGEALVLLAVLLLAARRLTAAPAVAVSIATAAATIALPLRERAFVDDPSAVATVFAAMLVLTLLAAGTLTLALYLRGLDQARTEAVASTRASERVGMAAELHDFVAHHVTGILAEARMCQMMIDTDPERVRVVLRDIEDAAAEASQSMRRTVHLLRATPTAPDRAPRGTDDLAGIGDLTARWDKPVRFVRGDAVTGDIAGPVQAAAFRIVREALTNIRKHAPDATSISVALDLVDGALTVDVRNDGARRAERTPGTSTGLGLIGLRERVTALDGRFHCGPTPGHGWAVSATLPLRAGTATRSSRR